MASAMHTQDHDTIRKWVEERGGIPTVVQGTGGVLRIDFVEGDGREEKLDEVSWDRWFETFDDRGLTFLYAPEKDSRFCKLVFPEAVEK